MQHYHYNNIKEDVDQYNKHVSKHNALLHLSKSLDNSSDFDLNLVNLFQFILKEKKLNEISKYNEKYQEIFHNDNYERSTYPNIQVTKKNIFSYLLNLNFNHTELPINEIKTLFSELQNRGISLSKNRIIDFYDTKLTELKTECNFLDDLKLNPQVYFSSENSSIQVLLNNNIPSSIYQLILDFYQKELTKEEFTKELQQNGVLHFLIKNNRLDDIDYVIKNFNMDLNLPNKDGIVPVMEVADLKTLSHIGKKYNINWNSLDSDGKNIEHYFSKKTNSFSLINYITKNKSSAGLNVDKEEIYSKLLLLVESQHTKKELESFIKTHNLSDDDFAKIKNKNNNNLNYIAINMGKFKYLDLFKKQKNLTDRNNDNLGVLELLLLKQFQLSQNKDSQLFISELKSQYKEDSLWSYNIIFNLLKDKELHLSVKFLNNNLLNTNFYSNVFYNSKTIIYNTKRDDYQEKEHKMLMLIEHFIEKQPQHDKNLLDLIIDSFYYSNKKTKNRLFADSTKILFISQLLSFKDTFEINKDWKFSEFNEYIEKIIVKDLNEVYEENLTSNITSALSILTNNPDNISYDDFLLLPYNDFKQNIIAQINKDFFGLINTFAPILEKTMSYSNHFIDFFNEIYSDFPLAHEINANNQEFFKLCEYSMYNKEVPTNNSSIKRKNKL